jgi:hypothetical protein
VAEGAVVDLLLRFSRKVAGLAGDVEASQDQPDEPAYVLLIRAEPYGPEASWALLDQTFHFAKANLRPGKYLAFAVQDAESAPWKNVEFSRSFESDGAEVQLHENENATVHLKLIPKNETDSARKRLGL